MSRKILFKAKRKNWRELPKEEWWVEGYVYRIAEELNPFIMKIDCHGESYEIDPETLCQYTGLHDATKWEQLSEDEKKKFLSGWNYKENRKNRKEDWCGQRIWENDVIAINTYDYQEPAEDFFGKVVYVDAWACWCILQPGEEKPIPMCECEGSYLTEIIIEGNSIDNPELLEEA